MWKDKIQKRFFWATMESELEKILYELIKAEEEEDGGIFLLMMHYDHAVHEDPLLMKNKDKILHNLSILIGDSRKHQKLLQEAIEVLEKKAHDESRTR